VSCSNGPGCPCTEHWRSVGAARAALSALDAAETSAFPAQIAAERSVFTEGARRRAHHAAIARADAAEFRWERLRQLALDQDASLREWLQALLDQVERESETV